jgi:hypothetical protein
MLGLLRPGRMRSSTSWHHYRPQIAQQWVYQMPFAKWRSTPTKRATRKQEDGPDPGFRLPTFRPSILYSEKGRAFLAEIEEDDKQRQEKLWAALKRAEAQLPLTNDIPQRRRALDRIYADLVADNASSLATSSDHFRRVFQASDPRVLVRLMEETRRLENARFLARARAARLWVFAPMQDVGVFRRLGRLLFFVGSLPFFLALRLMTTTAPLLRHLFKLSAEAKARIEELEDEKRK